MYSCTQHENKVLTCETCIQVISSSIYLTVENTHLKHQLKSVKDSNDVLSKKKKELLSTLEQIKQKLYMKSAVLPKNYMRELGLTQYILNLSLPLNILSIVYNPELAIGFLFQKKILDPVRVCKCGKQCELKPFLKSFFYYCECGFICPVTEGTFWDHPDITVGKIVLILFLWCMNQPNTNILNLVNVERKVIKPITEKLRSIIAEHFRSTLPKFKGVVEIDESCFRSAKDKPSQVSTDKWVFGLYERERKLIYMQLVHKRTAPVLVPIIQKVCEVGTTIISDQWSAYNKLAEFGFPHYTVDHSRFFVNPKSREIHTQNIEISWCWAKYWIKKHRRLVNFQDYLDTFCWIRQFKAKCKKVEVATVLNEVSEILNAYRQRKIVN